MNIVIAILVFSVVVIIHELGHFLLAVQNGIFVTEFSIGMGPRLISLVKTENGYRPKWFLSQHNFEHTGEWNHATKYSIKLLPLGGSCMMMGEDEVSDDDRAFNKKGVWARISVIFAGPLFNFILAYLLAMFIIGNVGYDAPRVERVTTNSPAASQGLQEGDIITKINKKAINLTREWDFYLYMNPLTEKEVTITYERNGTLHTTRMNPTLVKTYMLGVSFSPNTNDLNIIETSEGMPAREAGLQAGDVITSINGVSTSTRKVYGQYIEENPLNENPVEITYTRDGVEHSASLNPKLVHETFDIGVRITGGREKTGILGVIRYSFNEIKFWIVSTVQGVGRLVSLKVSPDEIGGPVAIFGMIGDAYEASKSYGFMQVLINLANITILLSANLGVMNLLPIPALDGGRLVFLLLEVFRGKPIDQNKEGLIHMIGLVALMILMVFVFFNDISRLF